MVEMVERAVLVSLVSQVLVVVSDSLVVRPMQAVSLVTTAYLVQQFQSQTQQEQLPHLEVPVVMEVTEEMVEMAEVQREQLVAQEVSLVLEVTEDLQQVEEFSDSMLVSFMMLRIQSPQLPHRVELREREVLVEMPEHQEIFQRVLAQLLVLVEREVLVELHILADLPVITQVSSSTQW
jgi:hypothetical protein